MSPSTLHSTSPTRLTSKTTPPRAKKSAFFFRPRLIPTPLFFSLFFTKFPFFSTHFSSNSPSDSPVPKNIFPVALYICDTPSRSPLHHAQRFFYPSREVLPTSHDSFVSCDSLSQARGVLFHNSVSTQFLIYAAAHFFVICSLASSVGRASAF